MRLKMVIFLWRIIKHLWSFDSIFFSNKVQLPNKKNVDCLHYNKVVVLSNGIVDFNSQQLITSGHSFIRLIKD